MRSMDDLFEIDELDRNNIRSRFSHKIVKVKKKPPVKTKKLKQKYHHLWYLKKDHDDAEK